MEKKVRSADISSESEETSDSVSAVKENDSNQSEVTSKNNSPLKIAVAVLSALAVCLTLVVGYQYNVISEKNNIIKTKDKIINEKDVEISNKDTEIIWLNNVNNILKDKMDIIESVNNKIMKLLESYY